MHQWVPSLALLALQMSNIQDLLANEQEWKRQHFKPLGLGAPSGVSVVRDVVASVLLAPAAC